MKNTGMFSENLKVKAKLDWKDMPKLAEYSGLSLATIRQIMNGKRRMTDVVKAAVVRLFDEKKQLNQAIEEIINN